MKSNSSDSLLSAAYASIVDTMIIATESRSHQRWLITGALAGDGTTTTAIGIARAMAARKQKGLLVDANLRNPSISRQLDDPSCPGLVQVIQNGRAVGDLCQRKQQVGDFGVLPAGGENVEPFELLSKPRTAEILRELSEQFDFAVVDTPALERGLDALALVPHVDGCVLVVRAGKTGRRAAVKAEQQIEQAGGRIVGVVLNRYQRWIPRVFRKRT